MKTYTRGERFKKARTDKGLSLKKVSEETNVQASFICNLENNKGRKFKAQEPQA